MIELKYTRNIVTDTKPYTQKEIEMQEDFRKKHPFKSTVRLMRLLWMDDTMVKGSSMYMECCWLWNGQTPSGTTEEPHMHEDFDEVIGFISTDKNNPGELGGRMEIILGDETHFLTKSCLVYIPAGMKHCPLTFREVNRPIFFFTLASRGMYGRRSEWIKPTDAPPKVNFVVPPQDASGSRYARYILTTPSTKLFPPILEQPKAESSRVVSLNDNITEGNMQAEFMWLWNGSATVSPEKQSIDHDEMIGVVTDFDEQNPRELKGNVEISIDNEKLPLTKSSLIFIPRGLNHYPLVLKDIEKPILLFTIRNSGKYAG